MLNVQNQLNYELTNEQYEILNKHFPDYFKELRADLNVKLYELLLESAKQEIE